MPRPFVWLSLVIIGCALIAALGCARPPADNPAAAEALTGAEWLLVELQGAPVIADAPAGTPSIRFTAEDSLRVGGSTGCNSYGGTYEVSGTTLRFGQLVSTLRACADSAIDEQGTRFLSALQRTEGYRIAGDRLVLFAGGDTLARFERSATR